jgi:hypothetical protein
MKDYHETLKNPAFRDINSKPEVHYIFLFLNFRSKNLYFKWPRLTIRLCVVLKKIGHGIS